MESRKSIRNLFKSIHSILGLKTQLTSTWAESVCNIIKDLPFEGPSSADSPIKCHNFNTMGCFSENNKDEDDLDSTVLKIQDEIAALNEHLDVLNLQRKQALNDLLELKGNIRVFCRIKPMNMMEKIKHLGVVIAADSNNVLLKLPQNKSKSYSFDKVFNQDSSQDEVFSEVEPVIKSALDGYNACIFAYGQTGTGKTFTMEGQPDCPGVVPCAIEALFKQAMDSNHTFVFMFSMLEIYMGSLRDLLVPQMTQPTDPNTKCLSIQSDPTGGIEIDNLVSIRVSDFNQAKRLYRLGSRFRSTASTNSNATSSRSHCLIRISLSCFDEPERRRETNKLWMVDLGGSERVLKTKAWGKRLEEGKAINLSLSALGDVINALQRRKPHIPYRNSKLTQVLRDSLGDNSKTLMLVHVSSKEEDLCETVCSLGFATRVRSIHLGHEEPNAKKENAMAKLLQNVKELELESQGITRELKKLNERLEHLTRSSPSPDQHLEVSNPYNEVLQSNIEIEKLKHRDVTGTHSSKLPRFMRPTICSTKKSGMDLPRKEKGRKKEPNRTTRLRRTSSLRAESITFPIKGVSEYGSEYSISRNSCLVGPNSKYSADYETDYSYDASECHVKLVVSAEEKKSESSLAFSRSHISYESSEGFGNGKEYKTDCRKDSTVDNWFNLQENEPTNKTCIYRGKRVVAIPLLGNKDRSNETEETETLHSVEVVNNEFAKKKFFNHDNIKKLSEVGITQRSITELEIDKTRNSYEHFVTEDSVLNSTSLEHGVTEEIQGLLDGFSIKNYGCNLGSSPNIVYDGLKQKKDFGSLTGMHDEQLLMDHETQSSLEDFTVTESGCNPFSPSGARNNRSNQKKESNHHLLKLELESKSLSFPNETPDEAAFLPNTITRIERKSLVSDSNICIYKREDGDFCGSPQNMENHTVPGLREMRYRRYLFMDCKDTNEELCPSCFIDSQGEIQKIGICDLLRQEIQILHSGALLGLGIQSLGLGNDFFYGLML